MNLVGMHPFVCKTTNTVVSLRLLLVACMVIVTTSQEAFSLGLDNRVDVFSNPPPPKKLSAKEKAVAAKRKAEKVARREALARQREEAVAMECKALLAMPHDEAVKVIKAGVADDVLRYLIGREVIDPLYDAAKRVLTDRLREQMIEANQRRAKEREDMERYSEKIRRDHYRETRIESREWTNLHPDRQNELLDREFGKRE